MEGLTVTPLLKLFLCLLSLSPSCGQLTRQYDSCNIINLEHDIRMYWTLEGPQIKMAIQGKFPNGYLAVGIHEGTQGLDRPFNADLWAASYSNNVEDLCYQGCVVDGYIPTNDHDANLDADNLVDVSISRVDGLLFAEWDRLLTTGSANDKTITPGTMQQMVWAAHPTNLIREDIGEHSVEGSFGTDFGRTYSCDQPSGGNTYKSPGGDFRLEWQIDEPAGTITFTMECDCTGWVSLGISQQASMSNMDCYTGWVTGGTPTLEDSWSINSVDVPTVDTALGGTSDTTVLESSEANGVTRIVFSRALETGDTNGHDEPIVDADLYVIWAYTSTADSRITKHNAYGAGQVNFFRGASNTTGGGTPIVPSEPPAGPGWESPTGDFKVTWEISDDEQFIHFLMEGQTTGWISIGYATHDLMQDTDFVTGWIQPDGSAVLLDTMSPDYATPREDIALGGTSDVELTGAKEENGWTSISFRRPIATGDPNDQEILKEDLYLMYGYHDSQDGSAPTLYAEHTHYGSSKVNFWTGSAASSIEDIFSPGWLLILICAVGFFIFVGFRMGHKIHKNIKDRKNKKLEESSTAPTTDLSQAEAAVPPGWNQMDHQDHWDAISDVSPMSGAYYRGSMVVKPHQLQQSFSDMEAEEKKKETIEPKKSKGFLSNFSQSLKETRIPKTQFSVWFVLIVMFYLGLNAACFFIGKQTYTALGSLLAANALLLTIPATRNSLFVWVSGIPFDRTILYHRWLGRCTIFLTLLHVVFSYVQWISTGTDVWEQTIKLSNVWGLLGFVAALFIFGTSLEWMRRKYYEVFHILHFAFLLFFLFGVLHSEKFFLFAMLAAGIYGMDKLLRVLWGVVPMRTLELNYKQGDIVQVKFRKHFFAKLFHMHRTGQYMFVNFPTISPLEWHPFSISSGPDETTVEIHVKALGDHTRRLVEKAKTKSRMWIRTDGPYGNHRVNYRRFPVLVLVAGGIGITPVMGILKDCFHYGQLEAKAKVHRNAVQKVYVLWTVQNMDQYHWFSEELRACYAASGKSGLPKLELMIYVTRSEGELDGFFYKGRPNVSSIFQKIVEEQPRKASTVFTCGPRQLVNQTWDSVNSKQRSGHTFHFHHETFEF